MVERVLLQVRHELALQPVVLVEDLDVDNALRRHVGIVGGERLLGVRRSYKPQHRDAEAAAERGSRLARHG